MKRMSEGRMRTHLGAHRVSDVIDTRPIGIDDRLEKGNALRLVGLPVAQECRSCRRDGAVDISRRSHADRSDRLLRSGIDNLSPAGNDGFDPSPIDVEFQVISRHGDTHPICLGAPKRGFAL